MSDPISQLNKLLRLPYLISQLIVSACYRSSCSIPDSWFYDTRLPFFGDWVISSFVQFWSVWVLTIGVACIPRGINCSSSVSSLLLSADQFESS